MNITQNTKNLEKIDRFPVGRAFSTKQGGHPVKFGWIIGYGINQSGELVFRIRWAHKAAEQLLHPSYVHSVLTDWLPNAELTGTGHHKTRAENKHAKNNKP